MLLGERGVHAVPVRRRRPFQQLLGEAALFRHGASLGRWHKLPCQLKLAASEGAIVVQAQKVISIGGLSRLRRPRLADRRRPDRRLAVLLVDREAHALAVVLRHQIRAVLLQLGGESLERDPVGRLPQLRLELAEPVERLAPVLLVGIALFRCRKGKVLHGDRRAAFLGGDLLVPLAQLLDQRRAHRFDARRLVARERFRCRFARREARRAVGRVSLRAGRRKGWIELAEASPPSDQGMSRAGAGAERASPKSVPSGGIRGARRGGLTTPSSCSNGVGGGVNTCWTTGAGARATSPQMRPKSRKTARPAA